MNVDPEDEVEVASMREDRRVRRTDDQLLMALQDAVSQLDDVTCRLRSAIEEHTDQQEQGHA